MKPLEEQLKPRFPILQDTPTQRPGRRGVWLAIIALWTIGWGQGSVTAVLAMFNARPPSEPITHWGTAIERSAGNLFELFCIIVLTLILIKFYAGVSPTAAGLTKKSARTPYAATFTVGAYIALLYVAQSLSDAVGHLIPAVGTPWYIDAKQAMETPQDNVVQLASSISAGGEEVVFTAGIIVLLYAAGYKPWVAWLTAIILRTSFHLYYFPDMLWVPLWAAGTIYIYQRFGCLWIMVTVHALIDVGIILDRMVSGLGTILTAVVAVGLILFDVIRESLSRSKKSPEAAK
ncbi:CPBP family intramembrane glutamic endopeptidase [Glutamicibacter arilaitensis]|uniref:CPBP family intramembrane glutamic endopeptidase n=1 Tax=Glutamicibacter TaxID=1742989 RepID=UPI003F91BAAB